MTQIIPAAAQSGRRALQQGIVGILATTLLVSAIACSGGDSGTGPSNRNPVGPYALVSISKKTVPYVLFRGPYTPPGADYTLDDLIVTVTGGELVLQRDGGIHVAIEYEMSAGGDELRATDSEDGTYEIQGDEIVIASGGGGMTGSYYASDGIITLTLDVMGTGDRRVYTFRRAP
jgi:hypothetical protein